MRTAKKHRVTPHKRTPREEAFTYNLVRLFEQSRMTKTQFGKAIGFSPGYYSYLASGYAVPSFDTAMKIAGLFHTTVEQMMDPASLPDPSKGLFPPEEDPAENLRRLRRDVDACLTFCRKIAADLGAVFEEPKP